MTKTVIGWMLSPIAIPGIGLLELKEFIGGELTTRIEKAVLGTLHDTRDWRNNNKVTGHVWWENPNLQDIPVLISLGIPPKLLEDVERVERQSRVSRKTWPRLKLQGLSRDPEKVIAKLLS